MKRPKIIRKQFNDPYSAAKSTASNKNGLFVMVRIKPGQHAAFCERLKQALSTLNNNIHQSPRGA